MRLAPAMMAESGAVVSFLPASLFAEPKLSPVSAGRLALSSGLVVVMEGLVSCTFCAGSCWVVEEDMGAVSAFEDEGGFSRVTGLDGRD